MKLLTKARRKVRKIILKGFLIGRFSGKADSRGINAPYIIEDNTNAVTVINSKWERFISY